MGSDGLIDLVFENKGKFFLLALVAGAATLGSCSVLNKIELSNGTRIGVINKFSKKGYIFKTYEGEMALEGLTSSGGQTSVNVWDFSINANDPRKDELAEKIKTYMNSAQKVRINYSQKWSSFFPRGSTDYFISDVQPVNPSTERKN